MRLEGKSALVTGGASGIGEATVSLLQAMEVRVASVDLRPSPAADVSIEADAADEDQMTAAVRTAQDELGVLTMAVLGAGIGSFTPIRSMTLEEWDRVHRVNLRGVFLGLRTCAEVMSDGGAVVAVSSTSSFLAERGMGAYSTSKAGVSQLVRVAARELGPAIRVNAVAPGTTDTPLLASTPPAFRQRAAARSALNRVGTAVDIAAVIVSLLSLDWVTGQVLVADGGLSLYSPIDPMETYEIDD
jgi:NAD(P)-dependent dehydrogenase (short-subunit alcohol dehydrogenase family)